MVDRRVPLDVILEILVWLPAKSALRFKCICKEWYDLINTPLFAKLQLNKSLKPDSRHNRILICDDALGIISVDDLYDPLKWIKLNWPKDSTRHGDIIRVVGSCNGLVCFNVGCWNDANPSSFTVRCFFICNPTTRNFKSILGCSETKWMDAYLPYGFGYDIEHDDYKIVATSDIWTENDSRHVCVYSLKTGLWSWTDLPTSVSTGRCNWIIKSGAIYVNNMLNYLVILEHKYFKIARFDIVSEKWRDDLSLPVQVSGYVQLGNLDGRLYLNVGEYDIYSSDVWMMEEYGSWKKMFHFSLDLSGRCPIARSKDGCDHRLLIRDEWDDTAEFFWYDQRDNTKTPFKLSETMPRDIESYELCIASLVAIPGGCSLTKLQQLEDGA